MKTIIDTTAAPKAIGPYSQAIAVNPWIFCSGQIPLHPETGEMAGGGVEGQTRRVLENLKAVLKAGGCGLEDVVKTTVYMTDLAEFAAMNNVYSEYFQGAHPARATVQVAALPKGSLVEIDAVAFKP